MASGTFSSLITHEIDEREFSLHKVGILSIFPHKEHAFIINKIIQSLSIENIPILAMGNSLSSTSCVINQEKVPDAIRRLSKEFGLI